MENVREQWCGVLLPRPANLFPIAESFAAEFGVQKNIIHRNEEVATH